MGQITDRNVLMQLIAAGDGGAANFITLSNGSAITAAAAGSGDMSVSLKVNAIGSTLPNTLVDVFKLPAGTDPMRLAQLIVNTPTAGMPAYLCHLYKIGTQVLTTTGNQFTHDAATFPVLRTIMGQASSPVSLLPLIQVTTATTVTAAVLTMKTVAGGTGYVDQDGNNVVGTLTHTMPAAATTINSCYFLPLEDGDSGIRDIAAIQTNTAATAGAASIWGVEIIMPIKGTSLAGYGETAIHAGIERLVLPNLRPAVATSGTATSALAIITMTQTGANVNFHGHMTAVRDV